MFYPKREEKKLDDDLFKNPTSEYRAAPFWAWNYKLDAEDLCWQIEQFKKMGFGGFFMHSRSGRYGVSERGLHGRSEEMRG